MKDKTYLSPFKHFKEDFPASIVVFLVALPLCLGIALASDAPMFSGIIAGIIGGIVVGSLSGSPLGVSGPAAGLAVIVAGSVQDLGGFEVFMLATVLAGILQLIMGFIRAGIIAYYFPSSVIHGMLAGIGILIFFKQIPHAFGYDKDPEGDFEFIQEADHENTFSELYNMLDYVHPGVMVVTGISLLILIIWQTKLIQKINFLKLVPGPLLAVITGVVLVSVFTGNPDWVIQGDHLVSIPVSGSVDDFMGNFATPDFNALSNPDVYLTALLIAAVASIETLLCLEASDKQDPLKRISPSNRELKAQGVGNIISGMIGGLPITQVIVRSSANVQAGGRTKMSAILHGFLLLICVVSIPAILNMIPLATLAAILMIVGFKLAKPSLFKKMYYQGMEQFLPFVITIAGIVFLDLLKGVIIGLFLAVFILLRNNFKLPFRVIREKTDDRETIEIVMSEHVSFLNKAAVRDALNQAPENSKVVIDCSQTSFIHHDVTEIIEDFKINAQTRDIIVEMKDTCTVPELEETLS